MKNTMVIPYDRWYPAIGIRRSRRLFDARPVAPALLSSLQIVCKDFSPFCGVRSVLIPRPVNEVFKGIIGHYGKIRGAPAFIAFIGNIKETHVDTKVGYMGEGIILEATSLNLDTCWVGASFRQEVVASYIPVGENEKVFAVTPIGYAGEKTSLEEKVLTGFGRTRKRKSLRELCAGLEESKWPFWIKCALEAARLAPSAVNRQPWRFHVGEDSITITVDNLNDTYHIPKRLDCGIALLHIEGAARYHGVKGHCEFLPPPDVARFSIREDS